MSRLAFEGSGEGPDVLTTLYERNGIYCFGAWVKPGPQKEVEKEGGAISVNQEKVGERSPAASRVRVSTQVEKKAFDIAEHGSKWQPVPKKKDATKNGPG